MKYFTGTAVALAFQSAGVWARCPNDCSGNGDCNPSSMCECFEGYLGNDCSQRQCTYTRAYVDTPLGDLNGNEALDVDNQVFLHHANAPVGETYPVEYGIARTNNEAGWNEAHFYRECANKGICDRRSGLCDCFPGFEGEGCQRTACPSDCSGHGKCILRSYDESQYDAWDRDVTQGCVCDPGYTAADCSKRECPVGVDIEESRYTDTSTLFKIEFKAQGSKSSPTTFYDGTTMLPNGQTLFTVTLKDEFGDEFTTPASTIYYQADCSSDTDEWNPDTSTSASTCSSNAFPVDPYLHNDDELRSIRSPVTLNNLLTNSSLLFEDSFVGEQLNNSLNTLPSSAARGSLVWVAANTAHNALAAKAPFLYPASNAPDFDALGAAATTQSATVCNLASEYQNNMCNSAIDFSVGPTEFINTPKFRFPIFFTDTDIVAHSFADAARRYLNCGLGSVCVFIRLDGPIDGRELTVQYKYKADIYIANRTDYSTPNAALDRDAAAATADYQVFSGPEMTGWSRYSGNSTGSAGGVTTMSTNSIVEVTEVGSDRVWNRALDGTPEITFNSGIATHTCSKRGLCDFDTGLCNCFEGYEGVDCGVRL